MVVTGTGKDLIEIILLSLTVSGSSVLISTCIGVPLGALLGIKRFPGRRVIMRVTYMLMSLPPVLAGLLVYLLLSRSGPLGFWEVLFTPTAMVCAQVLLVTPIITGLSASAIAAREQKVLLTALTMGASSRQAVWTVIKEARTGITAAIITGFGRAFGEVGAVMLVGGNIKHFTRVLTTSIVLETRQGNFEFAITLGLVLLALSFIISSFLLYLDESGLW